MMIAGEPFTRDYLINLEVSQFVLMSDKANGALYSEYTQAGKSGNWAFDATSFLIPFSSKKGRESSLRIGL